jgi:hypothetical protein
MKSNKIRVLPGEPQDGCLDQSYFRYRLFLFTVTLNGEKNVCLKDLDHKLKEESKRKYESRQRELWIKQRDD